MNHSFYTRYGKRAFDVVFSLLGLLILAPLFLICALLIKLTTPGPVFFRQIRTGLRGKPFSMRKFRSMRYESQTRASLLTSCGDPRITPVGAWLRKAKIDELPQLLDVVVGNMSLVGPRPEVPLYTNRYTEAQRTVLSVKPGITGLASVTFPAEEQLLSRQKDKEHYYLTTLMPFKIDLELQYCGAITLSGDLRILLDTILKISSRSRQLTMPATMSFDPCNEPSRNPGAASFVSTKQEFNER